MDAPKNLGELRRMLAETMHEVRYGHMDPARGIATAKIAAQIANAYEVEIKAWVYIQEMDGEVKSLGKMPINTLPFRKETAITLEQVP